VLANFTFLNYYLPLYWRYVVTADRCLAPSVQPQPDAGGHRAVSRERAILAIILFKVIQLQRRGNPSFGDTSVLS